MNTKFKPTGYKTTSNCGGIEIEISPLGGDARFRTVTDHYWEPTPWLKIEYDTNGAYCVLPSDFGNTIYRLDEFLRY